MPHYENEPKIDTTTATGDWRESLFRDGYVVVKGVLSPEKAKSYQDRMFEWLETFPYGFNAQDQSTWTKEHLPEHMKYDLTLPSLIVDHQLTTIQGWNVPWLQSPARESHLGCQDVGDHFPSEIRHY